MKPMKALLAAPLVAALLTLACASKNVQVHPGAVSTLDSQAYDTLLIAQEVITQAQASYRARSLPEAAKPVINRAVDSYNIARAAWLEYRAIEAGDVEGAAHAAEALRLAIANLVGAVANIPELEGKTP